MCNQDFAIELSTLLLGSVEDKLRWTFKLYDLNKECIIMSIETTKAQSYLRYD